MHLTSRLLTLLDRVSSPMTVHAHCDLPCASMTPLRPGSKPTRSKLAWKIQRLQRRGLQSTCDHDQRRAGRSRKARTLWVLVDSTTSSRSHLRE